MSAIHRTSACVVACLAVTLASGCGGVTTESAPPTCITSAQVAANEQTTNAKMGQLQNERDAARQDAALARQQAAADREQDDRQLRAVNGYIDYESTAYARLDRIDSHVKTLQTQASHAKGEQRAKIDKLLRAIATREENVQKDVRRIHKVMDADWPAFKADLDTNLDAMEHDLQEAEGVH